MATEGKAAARNEPGRGLADRRRAVVREFLHKHGLTPKALGRRGGFNPNCIYNFLNGVTGSLSAGTLERMLAAVPGATADDLLVLTSVRAEKRSSPRLPSPQVPQPRSPKLSARCRSDKQIGQNTAKSATTSTEARGAMSTPRHLTIAEAKRALAETFGVPPSMVEITVRG